jgi:hypothetical protein
MAKKPKRPQRPSMSVPRSATSSSRPRADARPDEPARQQPKGHWERFRKVWVEVVLGGVCGGLFLLWLGEWRAHEETRGKLDREETAKQTVTAERDALKTREADLQKENDEIRRLHPILQFYGPSTKLVTNYDLKKEAGSMVEFGACPQKPCFRITLLEMEKDSYGAPQAARLGFSGTLDGVEFHLPQAITYSLSLKQGCRITFEVGSYDITFVIEEDRINHLKAGLGISRGPAGRAGWRARDGKCPEG